MKLLITSPWMENSLQEWAKEFPQVEFINGGTPAELLAAVAEAEIVFGPVNEELFHAAANLRWIQSGSAGVEWLVHAPSLRESDVMVTNTRGAHASTIAEHTFGMLVFLARRFDELYEAQKRHEWIGVPAGAPRFGLAGLTMGIIGLGQLGRAVAKRAHAFEMEVIAVDVHAVAKPDDVAEVRGLDGVNDLIARSDVVVVATPITDQTRGMIGPEQLRLLKPSAYLLVISRGGIIHEPTLVELLQSGKLAGAGLDVTAIEPLPADSPLWDCPNLLITPHNSPSSSQTYRNVMVIMKDNLRRYLAGEPLTNPVDKKLGY
ncbi:MAG: D-2-hydroxyacid dehydrogenase [Caldilineaceae bacterium]|nr:D-2-hydroxyacid dehydrogenase [Caldilineaceae bacterium]